MAGGLTRDTQKQKILGAVIGLVSYPYLISITEKTQLSIQTPNQSQQTDLYQIYAD